MVSKSQFNPGTDTGSFHNVSPKKGIPPSSKAIVGLPSARFAHGNSLKRSLLIHVFLSYALIFSIFFEFGIAELRG
jgi:hypothetical protein